MVKSILTFSDIILYWDIYDQKEKNENYYVYMDNEQIGVTDKTHFTARDIQKRNVHIDIFTDENKGELFFSADFTLSEKPRFIDVTKPPYNAIGNGKVLNTEALQRAIDACGAGECVYFPKGVFLTGALNLHSHMEIYISEGAEIRGSTVPEDYLPRIWSRFEGIEMECYSSLLNLGNISDREAIACENVLIHGGGRIFGGGAKLAENIIIAESKKDENDPNMVYDDTYIRNNIFLGRVRPKLINISCAQNVVIDNIDIGYSSCWNLHMIYSKQIVTCNSRFHSFGVWNGDGWDPDSSEDCTIFNCDFNTGDDCIAIKSGKNPEGNIIAKPCKDIRIFDCRAAYGHSFAIGSEMSGGISDIHIWDCDLTRTAFGLEIKATKKRGGYVKDIYIDRCSMPRVMIHSVPYNDDGIAASAVPYFSNFRFQDDLITGMEILPKNQELRPCMAIEICGFDKNHKIENIVFENLIIDNGIDIQEQKISMQTLKNITVSNLTVK